MSHAHYLRVLGAVFAATMLGVIGFNVAVDPYGFFGSPRIVGFNAVKPKAGGQSHAAKAYQVARAAPTTVIIGNSRPEMGLDPRSACWRPEDRPVFNLGLRGAGFRMQADYLRHAVAGGTVRHAVIGLDFSEFVVDANERPTDSATRAGASETGSRPPPHQHRLRLASPTAQHLTALSDWGKATASLDALWDSVLTIALQHRPNQQNLREDGFNTARHYLSIIQTEGQQVLFTEKMRTLRKMFSGRSWSLTRRHDGRAPVLEELERLLADLRAAGVRTTLFINPFHVDYLAVIRDAGLGPEMAAWKRALTRIAMADDAVTLWDFTTFSSLASERPAAKRGAPPLKWFWEPAHYRATLGELMLARMFGRDCLPPSLEQRALPAARGFGTLLTARGVERHLADESRALVNLPSVSRSRSDNVHGNLMPPMQHVSAGGLQ